MRVKPYSHVTAMMTVKSTDTAAVNVTETDANAKNQVRETAYVKEFPKALSVPAAETALLSETVISAEQTTAQHFNIGLNSLLTALKIAEQFSGL